MSVEEESVDWEGFEAYEPLLDKQPEELTAKEARAEFDRQMEDKCSREDAVARLMNANGYVLTGEPSDADVIDRFIRCNVEPAIGSRLEMSANWFAVLWDLSFVIGDMIIDTYPQCHWALGKGPKSSVFYNRAMIQGFSQRRPTVGTGALRPLVGYSLRLLAKGDREPAGQVAKFLAAQQILEDD